MGHPCHKILQYFLYQDPDLNVSLVVRHLLHLKLAEDFLQKRLKFHSFHQLYQIINEDHSYTSFNVGFKIRGLLIKSKKA